MADLVEVVLDFLSKRDCLDSLKLSEEIKIDHQKIVGAIKSLQSLGDVVECEQTSSTRWLLTAEGEEIAKLGSHEALVFHNVPAEGITQEELLAKVGSANGNVGFRKAMSLNWISIDKKAKGGPWIFRKVEEIEDVARDVCQKVADQRLEEVTEQQRADCKKRKLLAESKIISYLVRKGPQFTTNIEKQETELTYEMLASGSWRTKKFKEYNFNARGLDPERGHLHPLLKVRSQFRQIFLEMGFTEMPTNNFVMSSFWNFDALFQPQQHPARDAHDTFFLSDPAEASFFPMDYLEKVKEVHSMGGYGSQGHKCNWKLKEAAKNIMRTHTTGDSARMLYKLASQSRFVPSKFFSIDRVFRNETLDATHLAEFHQIEGLVADYGLSLGNLMGYIQEFFKKYGIQKLKFKPAYNPYTEPSMEIFSYHEGLKKWVEVGNSGMFRPEMLLPMGLPEGVSVIAWGLSLERPTMIKYGISNIRDLFGPRVDLQKVYENPICRLGNLLATGEVTHKLHPLERRLVDVTDRMRRLKDRLDACRCKQLGLHSSAPEKPPRTGLTKSVVDGWSITISCSPHHPPACLIVLLSMLKSLGSVRVTSIPRSSNLAPCQVEILGSMFAENTAEAENTVFPEYPGLRNVSILWMDTTTHPVPVMTADQQHMVILGEKNIASYLFHVLGESMVGTDSCKFLPGGVGNPEDIILIHAADDLMDACSDSSAKATVIAKLVRLLANSSGPMLFGSSLSVADVVAWSTLVHAKASGNLPDSVQRWFDSCSKLPHFALAQRILSLCLKQ